MVLQYNSYLFKERQWYYTYMQVTIIQLFYYKVYNVENLQIFRSILKVGHCIVLRSILKVIVSEALTMCYGTVISSHA